MVGRQIGTHVYIGYHNGWGFDWQSADKDEGWAWVRLTRRLDPPHKLPQKIKDDWLRKGWQVIRVQVTGQIRIV